MPENFNEQTSREPVQSRELEKEKMVDIGDGSGGTINARLVCTPAGGTKFYEDTKNATTGKLEIGKELKSYT